MNSRKAAAAIFLVVSILISFSACSSVHSESSEIHTEQSVDKSVQSSSESLQTFSSSVTNTSSDTTSITGGILIVYFSCTGNTKSVAQTIAKATGGTLFEITAVQPYSDADLNYNDDKSRTTIEQNDKTARPQISSSIENWKQYETVFIGYPIWWGEEPRILDTFAESYDFSGKTVITFCTSASSTIDKSEQNLKELTEGNGTWLQGKRLDSGLSENDISTWITALGIT